MKAHFHVDFVRRGTSEDARQGLADVPRAGMMPGLDTSTKESRETEKGSVGNEGLFTMLMKLIGRTLHCLDPSQDPGLGGAPGLWLVSFSLKRASQIA